MDGHVVQRLEADQGQHVLRRHLAARGLAEDLDEHHRQRDGEQGSEDPTCGAGQFASEGALENHGKAGLVSGVGVINGWPARMSGARHRVRSWLTWENSCARRDEMGSIIAK